MTFIIEQMNDLMTSIEKGIHILDGFNFKIKADTQSNNSISEESKEFMQVSSVSIEDVCNYMGLADKNKIFDLE